MRSALKLATILSLAVAIVSIGGCSKSRQGQQQSIQIKGSDTMVNLVSALAEVYMRNHPGVEISVTGGGSGTGISALINGTTDICASSRQLKSTEIDQAKARNVTPSELIVGMDGLAVMVNSQNPVAELTLEQVKKIYTGVYTRWGDVGGPDQPIVVLSRESNSGTYVYFQEHVLEKSDFSPTVRLMPSTGAIIQSLKGDRWAIGYGGVAYGENTDIKILSIKNSADALPVQPTETAVLDGSYPIARPLFFYTNGAAKGEASNFLTWCLTPEAQKIVTETGYIPLKKS